MGNTSTAEWVLKRKPFCMVAITCSRSLWAWCTSSFSWWSLWYRVTGRQSWSSASLMPGVSNGFQNVLKVCPIGPFALIPPTCRFVDVKIASTMDIACMYLKMHALLGIKSAPWMICCSISPELHSGAHGFYWCEPSNTEEKARNRRVNLSC